MPLCHGCFCRRREGPACCWRWRRSLHAPARDVRVQEFAGADVRFGDVQDMESLRSVGFAQPVEVVVSCLASRTGGKVGGLHCH